MGPGRRNDETARQGVKVKRGPDKLYQAKCAAKRLRKVFRAPVGSPELIVQLGPAHHHQPAPFPFEARSRVRCPAIGVKGKRVPAQRVHGPDVERDSRLPRGFEKVRRKLKAPFWRLVCGPFGAVPEGKALDKRAISAHIDLGGAAFRVTLVL